MLFFLRKRRFEIRSIKFLFLNFFCIFNILVLCYLLNFLFNFIKHFLLNILFFFILLILVINLFLHLFFRFSQLHQFFIHLRITGRRSLKLWNGYLGRRRDVLKRLWVCWSNFRFERFWLKDLRCLYFRFWWSFRLVFCGWRNCPLRSNAKWLIFYFLFGAGTLEGSTTFSATYSSFKAIDSFYWFPISIWGTSMLLISLLS